jgi:ubiquinone/menaquinone biosynthesis C-methylase UbiE
LFSDVDAVGALGRGALLSYLDRITRLPQIRYTRRLAAEALRVRRGHLVLDAGTAVGDFARDLAFMTGQLGSVTALDNSASVLSMAKARHDGSRVHYVRGDISALAFPDATFDRVHSERVLRSVPDPDRAVAELIRVLRPHGRLCVVDTDWEAVQLDGPPEPVLRRAREMIANVGPSTGRSMGRTLRRRLIRAGLADVGTEPVTFAVTDPDEASALTPMFRPATGPFAGLVPPDFQERWFAEVDKAVADGTFLFATTIWVSWGTKLA